MAQADFGTGKTLAVLAIVLGCFAILWPKIFYPMWQAAFALSSSKVDSDGRYKETDRPPHLHPGSINPRMRGSVTPENVHEKFMMRDGRPFPHPQSRQPVKSQPKSGGAMSIIMPIYTVGIIVFFIYTVLKLVFKKNPEEQKKPLIKDFHMDPEYRKFICQETDEIIKTPPPPPKTTTKRGGKKKSVAACKTAIPESEEEGQAAELDAKDYEIYKLKKKLEETEQAMERIIQHMGAVNDTLNKRSVVDDQVIQKSDVKIRNRKNKNVSRQMVEEMSETSKKCHDVVPDDDEEENEDTLEEDLTELYKMCQETGASMKSLGSDLPSDPIEEDIEGSEDEGSSEGGKSDEEEKDSLLEDMIKSENKRKPLLT
ncbi:resistance to inhibitors of cholinesterase protein 3 isoform X1 [Parasteatoda tepidariorum]|nr:resistance to inhibitors of cholinesterase protein 3 isoform X1 [Parasteatoda tepidariorum]